MVLMLRRLLSSYWVPRVGMEMCGWPTVISLSLAASDFLLLLRKTRKMMRPETARIRITTITMRSVLLSLMVLAVVVSSGAAGLKRTYLDNIFRNRR